MEGGSQHDLAAGRAWQVGVWDRMSEAYPGEIDTRFGPVVDGVIARAGLRLGDRVLDIGTGTGAIAEKAAVIVGTSGSVVATDVSPEMLAIARERAKRLGEHGFRVAEGGAEQIPADDDSFDVVLASLSLMYVVDRDAAAVELARVLRPGGRLAAAVWSGPETCDIVRFQQTAGSFAPTPPVPGVGPGALADPSPFLAQLSGAGIEARVETEELGFEFSNLAAAWEPLAGVTTADLNAEQKAEAQQAVRDAMWPDPEAPREFRNTTQFILGTLS